MSGCTSLSVYLVSHRVTDMSRVEGGHDTALSELMADMMRAVYASGRQPPLHAVGAAVEAAVEAAVDKSASA